MNLNVINQTKLIHAVSPANWSGSTSSAKYVSLKNYGMCYIWIHTGAIADGTGAVTVTQASAVAGTGAKAISFDHYYSDTGTANLLARVSSTSATFTLATANSQYVIPIDPAQLDGSSIGSASAFDCLTISVAAPGGNDYYGVDYILTNPRNAESTPLTAILD
jgi:hypothetical protein